MAILKCFMCSINCGNLCKSIRFQIFPVFRVERVEVFFLSRARMIAKALKRMKECNIGRAHYESLQWISENVMWESIV